MTKKLKLRVGRELAAFELFEDKAPNTCAALLGELPLRSVAIIAKVAGLELMMRVPFFVDSGCENETTAQAAGNVCFVPGSQNVCIFCEDLPGLGPCSLIGRITENLEGIRREALQCRRRQALDKTTGRTDSWGSSFFPTLYAWEESVAARNAFLTLRKTLLGGSTDLGTLKAVTGNLLQLYSSYFAMTNTPDTTALLRQAAEAVTAIGTAGDLRELLDELVRYCGRLHYWIEPIIREFEEATTRG